MIKSVCLAGAAGWAGSALSRGVFEAPDLELVAAISRSHAGQILGDILDIKGLKTPVFATTTEGLTTVPDVFVEYTKPDVAKSNIFNNAGLRVKNFPSDEHLKIPSGSFLNNSVISNDLSRVLCFIL